MGDLSVTVTRVVKAPIDRVFKAWTDPAQMEQWYGPEGMATVDAASNNRVGGKYRFTMKSDSQEFKQAGEYLEFDEPNKIVFTWGDKTRVSVEFKQVGDNSTEVSLLHTGFADKQSLGMHDQGWNSTFNKLAEHFAN